MKVTKETTFDSAHMLSNYQGKCHNLHGHTYKLQVTLEGDLTKEGDSQGMVMDFNELNQYMDVVSNSFDHAIIFSDSGYRSIAEESLFKWANSFDMNYIVMPGKCTCETMAIYIKEMIKSLVDMQRVEVSVRLWETPTSFAEV